MRTTKPLSIRKSAGEWDLIDQFITASGRKDLSSFLRSEISRLKKAFDECPDCVTPCSGDIKRRRPLIHYNQYEDLIAISRKMKTNPSEVIIRLIIDPILVPEY